MSHQANLSPSDRLPITRDLTLAYVFSLVIALLMAAACVISLLYQNDIYSTDAVLQSSVPTEVFNLVVGLPLLLGSIYLHQYGKKWRNSGHGF
jgi:hypothetical protein